MIIKIQMELYIKGFFPNAVFDRFTETSFGCGYTFYTNKSESVMCECVYNYNTHELKINRFD